MNRKTRRSNKIPSAGPKPKTPEKKYAVTYSGSKPNELSQKERAIVLAMISQVPYTAGLVDGEPGIENVHVHVMLPGARTVCLRWAEADIPGVFEGICPGV